MKKKPEEHRDELEQFQAYGEYSYAYRHAADQRTRKPRNERDPEEPLPEDIPAPEIPAAPPLTQQERARIRSRTITTRLLFLIVVIGAAILILQGSVFRLKTVYVIGNVTKTAEQVAVASGLAKGQNIFAISEDEVRRNLSTDHTIIFLNMQKDYPSTIYLYISERKAVAATQWLGLQYTLDTEGIVMAEDNALTLPQGMPTVTGWQVTNVHIGQKLEVRNPEQMRAYLDVISELGLQQYGEQVTAINVSDTDSLYLNTLLGITVRLGNREAMRAKIGALRTDIAYLQQLGKTAGVLDVSIPEDAKYRPDS